METYSYGGKTFDRKEIGIDYIVVYEYTCESCNYSWRLTIQPKNIQCPKCKSIKIYYLSKRSCDTEVSNEITIPKDSELL